MFELTLGIAFGVNIWVRLFSVHTCLLIRVRRCMSVLILITRMRKICSLTGSAPWEWRGENKNIVAVCWSVHFMAEFAYGNYVIKLQSASFFAILKWILVFLVKTLSVYIKKKSQDGENKHVFCLQQTEVVGKRIKVINLSMSLFCLDSLSIFIVFPSILCFLKKA